MADDRFLSMFIEEARELLQALEAGLMDLEARQEDRAHVDRTFRAAHTLKGAAGMVGQRAIAEFTHKVEAVLDRVRSGRLKVEADRITTLLKARDHLGLAVEAAAEGRSLDAPPELVARLEALASDAPPGPDEPPPPPPAVEAKPEAVPTPLPALARKYRVRLNPRPDLLRKGINPVGFFAELRELGPITVVADCSNVPPLDSIQPRDCYLSWTIDLETAADQAWLDEVFLFLDDRSQVTIEPIDASAEAAPPPPEAAPPAVSESEALTPPTPRPEAPAAVPKAAPPARLRVDAEQLDELLGLAGELAILTDGLQGLREVPAAAPWTGPLESLERLGRRLRDLTIELRMVPIEELFLRFPRVVRDLADRSGKQIALRIEGEDTRLDRTIIERLSEPLIHMIRNAIDHGLESPADRLAAGKPATGRLTIGAGYEGDRVVIRISDDGRGLDRARIAQKGVRLGMVPPDMPHDDPRVINLIFEPGFSTRDQAGELSGRGVGLDVVRDTIRALRGLVTVRSALGKGTTFLVHLPLTLALIDGLLVEVDGERYVVPMTQVDECVALAADDTAWAMHRRAVVVRGELVPLVPLRLAFGAPEAALPRRELLLTQHGEQRVGVVVDRLVGRAQTVIQPLDEGLAALRHFSGATILGDGSICLILDLATVVGQAGPNGPGTTSLPADSNRTASH